MIIELLRHLYDTYRMYIGTGAVVVLFVVSAFALICNFRTGQKGIAYTLLSPLGTIGSAVSELFKAVWSANYPGTEVKAAAVVFAVVLVLLSVTSSGEYVFSDEISSPSTNTMHMPEGLIGAADALLADCEDPKVLTMPGWGTYLSAYSSHISLMYTDPFCKDVTKLGEDERYAYTQLDSTHPNMKKIAQLARKNGCGYVIVSDKIWPELPLTYYGFESIYDDGNCTVYKEVSAP